MRIACPDCAAEYDVPNHLLAGTPRAMRCARCGRVWTPPPLPEPPPVALAPQPDPEPVSDPAPSPASRPEPPAPLARPPRRTGLLLAWLATAIVIAGAAAGAVTQRDEVVRAWPPAERAYRAIGL